jgi:hypothetical protein
MNGMQEVAGGNGGRGYGREQRLEDVAEFEGGLKRRDKMYVFPQGKQGILVVKRIGGQEVN